MSQTESDNFAINQFFDKSIGELYKEWHKKEIKIPRKRNTTKTDQIQIYLFRKFYQLMNILKFKIN